MCPTTADSIRSYVRHGKTAPQWSRWPAPPRSRPRPAPRVTEDLQMAQAARVKEQLIPQPVQCPQVEIAVSCEPFSAVGGDYVDVLPMPDGRILVALGDVCGKGVSAALVATATHGMIHSGVADGHNVQTLVQRLDAYLRTFWTDGLFVTLVCVAIDPATGATQAVNAGHLPVLIGHPAGSVRQLRSYGTIPLGIEPVEACVESDAIDPDQILLLYSDGWTDLPCPSGEFLGINGLTECWREACRDTQGESLSRTLTALKARAAKLQSGTPAIDDRTLLLVRRRLHCQLR